jgi:hypothetical protein
VSRYTPEERARILEDARETLRRLNEEEENRSASDADDAERPPWPSRPDILDHRQRSSEPMRRWRADAEEWERRVQRERERSKRQQEEHVRQMQAKSDDAWNAWADAKIDAALKAD